MSQAVKIERTHPKARTFCRLSYQQVSILNRPVGQIQNSTLDNYAALRNFKTIRKMLALRNE
jgi:hypothetical protein